MKENGTNCPYERCGCCRKCQLPCQQQQELAKKAYKLARNAHSSTSEIISKLSRAKDGEDTSKDASWYSLLTNNAIGALIRMQSLIGDLQKGGAR